MRKLAIVRVPWESIAGLLTEGFHVWKIKEGLPYGAKLFNSYIDNERRTLNFIFEHDSFSETGEGMVIPDLETKVMNGIEATEEFIKTEWFKIKMEEVLNEEEIRLKQ